MKKNALIIVAIVIGILFITFCTPLFLRGTISTEIGVLQPGESIELNGITVQFDENQSIIPGGCHVGTLTVETDRIKVEMTCEGKEFLLIQENSLLAVYKTILKFPLLW